MHLLVLWFFWVGSPSARYLCSHVHGLSVGKNLYVFSGSYRSAFSVVLGEICIMHIFRSILINSSSFFYNFLTSIYANILLRLFSIFSYIFLNFIHLYLRCFCLNLSKVMELFGSLCNSILTISFSFHTLSHFFPHFSEKCIMGGTAYMQVRHNLRLLLFPQCLTITEEVSKNYSLFFLKY